MHSVAEFLRTFGEFMGRHGRPVDHSPWALVEQWEALVEDLDGGDYGWSEVEYTNDLRVRDVLEKAFTDERLAVFAPQIDAMRDRVERADDRLRALFIPGVRIGPIAWPWWRRGVLARAGSEYAEDIRRIYGVELPEPPTS